MKTSLKPVNSPILRNAKSSAIIPAKPFLPKNNNPMRPKDCATAGNELKIFIKFVTDAFTSLNIGANKSAAAAPNKIICLAIFTMLPPTTIANSSIELKFFSINMSICEKATFKKSKGSESITANLNLKNLSPSIDNVPSNV